MSIKNVKLRAVIPQDLPLMLAWSHIPEIWEFMPTSRHGESLNWETHYKWWRNRDYRLDWIIEWYDGVNFRRPVGVIHAGKLDTQNPEIGLYIGEINLWGQGIGEKALEIAMEKLRKLGYYIVCAVIHPDNRLSRALFEKMQFVKTGEARNGQLFYSRAIGGSKG